MEVYGIANCDTVKKALTWLDENKFKFTFHNFKIEQVTTVKLKEWIAAKGWRNILNLKSTTYRKLINEGAEEPTNASEAIKFMKKNTSSIKRPVIEIDGMLIVGFNADEYRSLITKSKK